MKAVNYEMGRRYAQKLVNEVNREPEALVVTDCTLSALRLRKETRTTVLHPVEALARAYGVEGDAK
jgi:glycerol-3-phosphate dehydrogenase subunit C